MEGLWCQKEMCHEARLLLLHNNIADTSESIEGSSCACRGLKIVLLFSTFIVTFQIKNGHKYSSFTLQDYCDGKVYCSSSFYSSYPEGLQVCFYFDELEVANPLGSKIHKLGNMPIILFCLDTLFY